MRFLSSGVFLAFLGAICLSLMGESVKFLHDDVSNGFILFARFLVSFIFILPFVIKDKNFKFKINHKTGMFFRIIFGFFAMMMLFYCLQIMPASHALLFANTAPLFVPLFVFIITKQKTKKIVLAGIFISFIGIFIILDPSKSIFNVNIIIGVSAGFFSALAITILRIIGKDNTPNQMMFYFFMYAAIIGLIFGIIYWKPLSYYDVVVLVIVGIFGSLYQFFLTYALKKTQVRIVSPIMLTSVLYSGILDWLFRGYIPSYQFLIGAIIIVVGILIVIKYSSK